MLRPLAVLVVGLLLGALLPGEVRAQSDRLMLQQLSLDDLSAFEAPGANWQVAGSVYANRHERHHLAAEPGTGILVNRPDEVEHPTPLFTTWEHGDLRLELDFLIPKESNSGIYFMGRYELQLLDSWGVKNPTYGDSGGIYQRWDASKPEGERGYGGYAPRMNVARAPGLWQHLTAVFRAPRFDASGEKVENARFVKVVLNGVVIHRNVEMTGPTAGAPLPGEQPTGPLMIQGNHGPIAFRNIQYKIYREERVELTDVRYRYYEGAFEAIADVEQHTSQKSGTTDDLTLNVVAHPDSFALRFTGQMEVPEAGAYRFDLQSLGESRLLIDQEAVVGDTTDDGQVNATGRVELSAGRHPFTLAYYKRHSWVEPSMTLHVQGPHMPRHELTAPGSGRSAEQRVDPIWVRVEGGSVVQRSFVMHDGAKRTHAVSVGAPSGVHYSLDLNQDALLKVWKGAFLDVTAMWHERGEPQLATPRGSVLQLSGGPSLAFLEDENAPWPDSLRPYVGDQFQGYILDDAGQPTFHYRLGVVAVTDRLVPARDGRILTRTLAFRTEEAPDDLWLRAAVGRRIERLPDGSYDVGSHTFYVDVQETSGATPRIRSVAGKEELLIPVPLKDGRATLSYSIIW